MNDSKTSRHLAAAAVYVIFLLSVTGGVFLLSPYALIWLLLCWPVAFISAGFIWYLAFSGTSFQTKAIRFGTYVLLCALTAGFGIASGGDAVGVAFTTTLLPVLGMFLFSYIFPVPARSD